MEEGQAKKRNVRPVEKSNLPLITLFILSGIVLALFYVGYEYLSDSTGNTQELTESTPESAQDVVSLDVYSQPSLVEPEEIQETPKKETPKKAEETTVVGKVPTQGQSYTHTVKAGETLFSIASRYNLKPETVKAMNPSLGESVKVGQKLKVQVQAIHTVGAGDILRVVGTKYGGVTPEQIMKANGKSKNFAERGEKLIVPFKNKQ